jgi:putative transposase
MALFRPDLALAPLKVIRSYVESQRKPSEKKHIEQSKRFTGAKRNEDKTWVRKGE